MKVYDERKRKKQERTLNTSSLVGPKYLWLISSPVSETLTICPLPVLWNREFVLVERTKVWKLEAAFTYNPLSYNGVLPQVLLCEIHCDS